MLEAVSEGGQTGCMKNMVHLLSLEHSFLLLHALSRLQLENPSSLNTFQQTCKMVAAPLLQPLAYLPAPWEQSALAWHSHETAVDSYENP